MIFCGLGWRDLFSSSVKRQILETLIKSDRLEDFIHVKFKGAKRFSVEGSDSAVVAIESVIDPTHVHLLSFVLFNCIRIKH